MPKVSVIIPSRNEKFLDNTINDLLSNCTGDFEIFVILDGYWTPPIDDPRVHYIHPGTAMGMRAGINAGAALAKGDYLLKIDAHCMVGKGFDEILASECEHNWVVIPQRRRLDADNWCEQDVGKPHVDYEYLCPPDNPADWGGASMHGRIWTQRILERRDGPQYEIDDNMSFQGSCWFMPREYFHQLGLMDEERWGSFWQEAQEIGLRSWLTGGKVMTNKKTHYCHLHKGKKHGRGYQMNSSWLTQATKQSGRFFAGEKMWPEQKRPLSWLIEHFWPVPQWTEELLVELKAREKLHFDQ